ncbi:MAG: adenylate/guanylate cyclase domain-containing protein, partial [bacterium]
IYEPMFPPEAEARRAVLDTFAQALARYHEGKFDEALVLFLSIEAQDGPAAAYARRCRELKTNPPATWTGVWIMTEK